MPPSRRRRPSPTSPAEYVRCRCILVTAGRLISLLTLPGRGPKRSIETVVIRTGGWPRLPLLVDALAQQPCVLRGGRLSASAALLEFGPRLFVFAQQPRNRCSGPHSLYSDCGLLSPPPPVAYARPFCGLALGICGSVSAGGFLVRFLSALFDVDRSSCGGSMPRLWITLSPPAPSLNGPKPQVSVPMYS